MQDRYFAFVFVCFVFCLDTAVFVSAFECLFFCVYLKKV